jgi:hypothetical protein
MEYLCEAMLSAMSVSKVTLNNNIDELFRELFSVTYVPRLYM